MENVRLFATVLRWLQKEGLGPNDALGELALNEPNERPAQAEYLDHVWTYGLMHDRRTVAVYYQSCRQIHGRVNHLTTLIQMLVVALLHLV